MRTTGALVLLCVAGCLVEGRRLLSARRSEVVGPARLQRMVDYANQVVRENQMDTIEMDDISYNLYLCSASFLDNKVSGMDTFHLAGDDQQLNITTNGQTTTYSFDVTIGFDKMRGTNRVLYTALFYHGSMKTDSELTGEKARFAGTLRLDESGLELALSHVELVDSGTYRITSAAAEGSSQRLADFLAGAAQFFMNRMYPWFRRTKRVTGHLASLAGKVASSKLFYQIITHDYS